MSIQKKIITICFFSIMLFPNKMISQGNLIKHAIKTNQRLGDCPSFYFVEPTKNLTYKELQKYCNNQYQLRSVREETKVIYGERQEIVTYFEFKPNNDPTNPCGRSLLFFENFSDNRNSWDLSNVEIKKGNLMLNSTSRPSSANYIIKRRTNTMPIIDYVVSTEVKVQKKGIQVISLKTENTVYQFGLKDGKPVIFKTDDWKRPIYTSKNKLPIKFGEYNDLKITKSGSLIKFFINENEVSKVSIYHHGLHSIKFKSSASKMVVKNLIIEDNRSSINLISSTFKGNQNDDIIRVNETGIIVLNIKNIGTNEIGNFDFTLTSNNPNDDIEIITKEASITETVPNGNQNLKFKIKSGFEIPEKKVSFTLKVKSKHSAWKQNITIPTKWFFASQDFQLVVKNENDKARKKAIEFYYGKSSIDVKKCQSILEKQITKGDKRAINWKGLFIYKGKCQYAQNTELGLSLLSQNMTELKTEVLNGDMEAAYLLMNYYLFDPETTQKNRDFGGNLSAKLVEDSYPLAVLDLANTLIYAKTTFETNRNLFLVLHQLYEANCLQAASLIGDLYFIGIGTMKDFNEAIKWYKIAFENGDYDAAVALSKIYTEGKGGIRIDSDKAIHLLETAIDSGSCSAIMKLADFYFQGDQGIPKDYKKGMAYIKKAADLGYRNAMYLLGLCYLNEDIVENVHKGNSFYWMEATAKAGEKKAMNLLADMYTNSDFTEPSLTVERYWRNKSGQGNKQMYTSRPLIIDVLIEGISTTPTEKITYEYTDGRTETVYESPFLLNTVFTAVKYKYRLETERQRVVNEAELINTIGNKKVYAAIACKRLETSIYIKKGSKVVINAQGFILFKDGFFLNDKIESSPKGHRKLIERKIYSSFNHGQLLYKIGDKRLKPLNKGIVISNVENSGYLTIIMNDMKPERNKGYFDIVIEVTEDNN
ncbi:MAG: tetratricopeptide repeat protein [Saprospiraceae bacterium]